MKIIISSAGRYTGIINAIKSIFDDVEIFNCREISPYDFFYKKEPDILIYDISNIIKPLVEISTSLECKKIIFSDYVIEWEEPDLICAYDNISPVMMKQLDNSHNVEYIRDYVNNYDIGGKFDKNLESDLGIISTGTSLEEKLLKILIEISSAYQLKIIGNTYIPLPNYLGTCDQETELDFINSVDTMIDLNGKNIAKYVVNKTHTLSTTKNTLCPTFNNMEEFDECVQHCVIPVTARKFVLNNDTNYHRLKSIIEKSNIDIPEWQKGLSIINNKIEELKK